MKCININSIILFIYSNSKKVTNYFDYYNCKKWNEYYYISLVNNSLNRKILIPIILCRLNQRLWAELLQNLF